MMRMKSLLAVALSLAAMSASAQVSVNGYVKKDGTYVAPHQRTEPNSTKVDNYSSQGNTNPYTGKAGTVNPYAQPAPAPAPAYAPPPPPAPVKKTSLYDGSGLYNSSPLYQKK